VSLLIPALLIVIAAGSASLMFLGRMRMLDVARPANSNASRLPDADRYRPMLRLLSDSDLNFAGVNVALRNRIRSQRREMFRGYLRCLARDYGILLSGIRTIMVESNVDRPDLAKALAKNRTMFALALCRIEVNLQLHALGMGNVDVSGLVDALGALRGIANVMTPATGAAY
jgi:hypothetical protein